MSDDNQNSEDSNHENGYYTENSDSDEPIVESDMELDEERAGGADDNVFDKNLSTRHKYLGRLDYISSYTLYDDGQILDSILGIHTNTLVFPGFTLPLILKESIDDIGNMGNGHIFALVCIDKKNGVPFDYGVIMEIYETRYKRGKIHLKAKGRQRCKILSGQDIRPTGSRMLRISVKVLGEPKITTPIVDTELRALKQKRCMSVEDYETMQKYYRHRRYHLAQYALPGWIYDYNELCFYVKQINDGLSQYYGSNTIPKDPILLSYWFVQNFQLSHDERLQILKCNDAWERLRTELKYLKLERRICCVYCNAVIAMPKDVFAMSKDGVQNNYCNSEGEVYETVTVLYAKHYRMYGVAMRGFSWFPGYRWTIIHCKCGTHIGWQFTSKHLQPQKFFGLATSGIEIRIKDSD